MILEKHTLPIIIIVLLPNSETKKVFNSEALFEPSTSDFSKVIRSKLFVDKSLLIKEMFSQNLFRILITAPPKFGKSVNMDMVKRFIEVDVDETGQPKPINTTDNYRLFKDNNLQINKYEKFFDEHFGKYPVLYLDFSVFRGLKDYDNLLFKFGKTVQRAFLRHNYLMHDPELWPDEDSKTLFMKFCNGHVILTSEEDIKRAFVSLLERLYRHFKKQVFILIDEYDAQIQGLIFEKSHYTNRIIIFFDKLIEDLLYCNEEFVQGSMLTGVLRVRERGMRSTGVCHFRFILDHPFSKFYGLREDELDEMLKKIQLNDEGIQETKQLITEQYKGYSVNRQDIVIYNIWSVFNFLQSKQTIKNKVTLPEEETFNTFKRFFKIQIIKEEILKLLSGQTVWAKIGDAILNDDIVNLNNALTQKSMENLLSIDLFKVLLYHFGYLSVTNKTFGQSVYQVRIPNKDIALKFKKSLA